MLRASLLFALSASAASAASETVCRGPACQGEVGGSEAEDAALLQVHPADATATKARPFRNPCPSGYNPKASTESACKAAGLTYTGNRDAAKSTASHCCVNEHWTCNMGDESHCKKSASADPIFLGDTADWRWEALVFQGNCCLPPNPFSEKAATWTMDTRTDLSEHGCKTTKVEGKKGSPSYTLIAFWTGQACVTTAHVGGTYYAPTCTSSSLGECSGVDIGEGICCYYDSSR